MLLKGAVGVQDFLNLYATGVTGKAQVVQLCWVL